MKRTVLLIGVTLVLFGCGILGSWYVLHQKQPQKIAEIYQNDTLLHRIDLSQVEDAYTITIEGEHGAQNVILVEPDEISMQSASCPDQLCVKQGAISDGILPIVCLPNHIRISIVSGEEAGYDVQVY